MAVEGARTHWLLIAWSYLEILFAQQRCAFWDALGSVCSSNEMFLSNLLTWGLLNLFCW